MAQPTAYVRNYDFTNFQEQFPDQSLPASPLDVNLDLVSSSIGQIVNRLALIQRDDGGLKNQTVTLDSLSSPVIALLGSSINPRGEWATGEDYLKMDLVSKDTTTYLCNADHTADVFATDLAAEDWILFSNPAFETQSTAFFQKFSGNGVIDTFILSDDLGTDENALLIFYDSGSAAGYQPVLPTSFYISGVNLIFGDPPVLGTDNILVFSPSRWLGSIVQSQLDASAASAAAALASEQAAAASAAAADLSADSFTSTSSTSLVIGNGNKDFVTQGGKNYTTGMYLQATSTHDATHIINGPVVSYNSTTGALRINATTIGGSGKTYSSWMISLSGPAGPKGDAGEAGAGTGDMIAANNLSDLTDADAALAHLGCGSAAKLDAGTSADNLVQLDETGKLPAVDGSQLINLPTDIENAARVYHVSTQSIGTSTWTRLSGNAESFDPTNMHNNTDGHKITVPTDGIYLVSACIAYNTANNGTFYTAVYINDTTLYIQDNRYYSSGINGRFVSVSEPIYLNAEDFVVLYGYQNTGASVDTIPAMTYLSVVGPLIATTIS